MNADLLTKIETDDGTFMVLTKSRYLGILNMPRSSIMPFDVKKFGAMQGFQIQYNTSETTILNEWHEMLCTMVRNGMYQILSEETRVGFFPYPDDKSQLAKYVKRFV